MLRCGKGHFADSVIIGVRHIDVSCIVHRHSAGTVKSRISPIPSVVPLAPASPANVVTTPIGVIFLTVLLPVSAT